VNFTGVCVATVAGLDDPEGEARVRVDFPMLPTGPKSAWAPLARPFAGAGRGMYYMPEVGDEALVAFEHGDFDHPFIVGFLWNGQDGQPDDDIDENVRRIQSKSGHQIDLDDRPGKHAIVINTAAGNTIEMSDGLVPKIKISTVAGNSVELSDDPLEGISATTNDGQAVRINSGGISVSAPSRPVTVSCGAATLTATSLLVTVPITEFLAGQVIAAGFQRRELDGKLTAVT
jgi:uncharacterized protein involved in type VI secretion and phage assembly